MTVPLLQIIHVSDLHFRTGPVPPRVDWLLRNTRRIPVLGSEVREGVAEYDTKAPRQFLRAVERFTRGEFAWEGPTWVLDTGDLSTFGDDKSITRGLKFLSDLAALCTDARSLHGNHDAWPGDFPSEATDLELDTHRRALRGRFFPRTWPEAPLEHAGRITVQVYGLNSVLHCPLRNTFALGNIDHDRFWDDGLDQPDPDRAMDELERLVDRYDPRRAAFRIVLTHHPLYFPSRLPWAMVSNRAVVARRLAPADRPPLAHLILSGHTHKLFPSHGQLPLDAVNLRHGDLAEGQIQLVVGALMQNSPRAMDAGTTPPHHQAQILRLYWNEIDRAVEIMRILLAKHPGELGYRLIKVPGTGRSDELLRIRL